MKPNAEMAGLGQLETNKENYENRILFDHIINVGWLRNWKHARHGQELS